MLVNRDTSAHVWKTNIIRGLEQSGLVNMSQVCVFDESGLGLDSDSKT